MLMPAMAGGREKGVGSESVGQTEKAKVPGKGAARAIWQPALLLSALYYIFFPDAHACAWDMPRRALTHPRCQRQRQVCHIPHKKTRNKGRRCCGCDEIHLESLQAVHSLGQGLFEHAVGAQTLVSLQVQFKRFKRAGFDA